MLEFVALLGLTDVVLSITIAAAIKLIADGAFACLLLGLKCLHHIHG